MKRSLLVLILVIGVHGFATSTDRFALSLGTGTVIPGQTPMRLGIGVLGSIAYSPIQDVEISLSFGYITWEYGGAAEWTKMGIVPTILGVRYYFSHNGFAPYVSGEVEYISGKIDDRSIARTSKVSEFGSGLGVGFQIPVAERLNLDVGSVILLSARTAHNIRLMTGLVFSM